jgi:hypothetical protein
VPIVFNFLVDLKAHALFVPFSILCVIQMSQEDQQRILYYTNLCETLYGPASQQDRERAEHILEHAFPTFSDAAGSGVAGRRPSLDSSYAYDISSPQDSAYALTVLLKNSPNPYVP